MTDLTVITNILMADGIGRQGLGFVKALKSDLSLNVLAMPPCNYKDVDKELVPILSKPFSGFGKVSLFSYILGLNEKAISLHQKIDSPVKFAYSMIESTRVPELWVKILNDYYDAVIVPDEWLVSIYQSSGVKLPIFVIPLGILIEDFLTSPIKTQPNEVFTFGMSAGFWERKNHLKVLQAFKQNFGNNDKFKLKLHGRFGPTKKIIEKAVTEAQLNNVELISNSLSQAEYLKFMQNLDCYVFVSQGEGFSITPREALALGIPCIVSNNSAHKTICKYQYLSTYSIKSDIKVSAMYEIFGKHIGNFYDCSLSDIVDAMNIVYDHYPDFLEKSQDSRNWTKQYLWENVKKDYINLFKPQKVLLGGRNEIIDNGFITNSKKLSEKFKCI